MNILLENAGPPSAFGNYCSLDDYETNEKRFPNQADLLKDLTPGWFITTNFRVCIR